MNNNSEQKTDDTISFKKKTLWAISPSVAISAVLISKHEPGPLLLFWIGIAVGVLIHRSLHN